jgi:hypothetical protein
MKATCPPLGMIHLISYLISQPLMKGGGENYIRKSYPARDFKYNPSHYSEICPLLGQCSGGTTAT